MNTQATLINESKKEATNKLQYYFNSKKWTDKIRGERGDYKTETNIQFNQQIAYQQGFREALTLAVNLMFDTNYQDLRAKEINLIEKILQDN